MKGFAGTDVLYQNAASFEGTASIASLSFK